MLVLVVMKNATPILDVEEPSVCDDNDYEHEYVPFEMRIHVLMIIVV